MKYIILVIASYLSMSCAMAQTRTEVLSEAGQSVVAPSLPTSINFAGERVPLEDSEVAIALTNEILVTKYMHSRTMKILLESRRYFAIIEPILKEQGVPSDFKYLCVAESSLDPTAYSSAKAAGLWQIMSATATDHKLEVNTSVDERYHVEKSTLVACQYLKKAHEKYGSWTMAAASYNVGMAGLTRRATSQKEDVFYNLFLPTETMRYIYRILTYKILCESPESMGFVVKESDYYPDFNYSEVVVKDATIDWVALAKAHNTTYKDLRALNNWIRVYSHTNSSKKSYTVKVPQK